MREAEDLEQQGMPGMVHTSGTFLDLLSESKSGRKGGECASEDPANEAEMRYARMVEDLCGWGLEEVRVAHGRGQASAILRREGLSFGG